MSILKIRSALEIAFNALPNIIPNVSITSSAPGANGTAAVFTTAVPHLLINGVNATISGHIGSTPALNGAYTITVTGPSTFTAANAATSAAVTATVGGTGGLVSANLIAWENVMFPTNYPAPYQKINFLFATPQNPTFGGLFSREIGFMQVTLYYPIQRGTFDIMTRAELIRTAFSRGTSFINGGIVVNISSKPVIMPGAVQDEVYIVPIKIPYWADLFS